MSLFTTKVMNKQYDAGSTLDSFTCPCITTSMCLQKSFLMTATITTTISNLCLEAYRGFMVFTEFVSTVAWMTVIDQMTL